MQASPYKFYKNQEIDMESPAQMSNILFFSFETCNRKVADFHFDT